MSTNELSVTFISGINDPSFNVDDGVITVADTVKRKDLSRLLNSLTGKENVPFDFIINNEFLRDTLHDFVIDHSLSAEHTITIKYVLAVPPPKAEITEEEDWISDVALCGTKNIATASYDKAARIYDSEGALLATLIGHTAPVRGISFVDGSEGCQVATVSEDEDLILWYLNSKQSKVTKRLRCSAHKAMVGCVASRPDGSMVCTGSWDRTVRLWSTSLEDALDNGDGAEERQLKKTKGKKSAVEDLRVEDPLLTLNAATAAVNAVVWPTENTLYSSGDDHSIKQWDIVSGASTASLTGPKVVNHMAYSGTRDLLACAGFDGSVRLYSTQGHTSISLSWVMPCHNAPVSSIAWSPTNEHQFATSSLAEAQNLRIWDTRSHKVPLLTVNSHSDKVMAICWSAENKLVSGGADSNLIIHPLN